MNLSIKDIPMNQIHGKIIIFFMLILSTILSASSQYASYNIQTSKKNIFVNEPIYITFHVRQKTNNEVMFFDFVAQKNDNLKIIPLESKRHEFNYHDSEKTFKFLVFAKKGGDFKVKFDFQLRRASDDAVAQAYNGSRDNVKSIPTIKVKMPVQSVSLHVEPLTEVVNAVGDFRLTMSINKLSSNSYDAINIRYNLSGEGYLDENFEPLKNIENTSIFRSQKKLPTRATQNGFIYNIEYNYAIVAKEDFTIPKAKLVVFSFKQKKYLSKDTNSKNIKITPLDINTLIDNKNVPKSDVDFNKYIEYVYDFMIFVAGFLLSKLLKYLPKNKNKKEDTAKYVKQSKTAQELLKAMMPLANKYALHVEIKELEKIIYNKETKSSFKEIKNKAIKKIN